MNKKSKTINTVFALIAAATLCLCCIGLTKLFQVINTVQKHYRYEVLKTVELTAFTDLLPGTEHQLSDYIHFDWDTIEVYNSPVFLKNKDKRMMEILDTYATFDWTDISALSLWVFYKGGEIITTTYYNAERTEFPVFCTELPDDASNTVVEHFFIKEEADSFSIEEKGSRGYCLFDKAADP